MAEGQYAADAMRGSRIAQLRRLLNRIDYERKRDREKCRSGGIDRGCAHCAHAEKERAHTELGVLLNEERRANV